MSIMAITNSSSNQTDQLVNQPNQSNPPNFGIIFPEPINFEECFRDSPKFRQNLKDNLNYIEHLETCMTKTIKQMANYIETGQNFIHSQKDFISAMKILNSSLGPSDQDASKHANTLFETLEEITKLQEIVIEQSRRTIGASLCRFISDDLAQIRETRKSFDKISHEYDQALTRHSQPVKKQQDDSENILIATSTAFTHTSLDLTIQLTTLSSKKGYEILSSLLSFIKAHSTFFHQGSDLFEDLKPYIVDMDRFLTIIQDEFETLVRNLPSKHLMVSNNELRPLWFDNKAQRVHLEGYLFKRASNGFKVWNRRWFILKDHQLLYQKRGETSPSVMEEDLRLLTVRPVDRSDGDRRFCFELVSPHKSHILQADSESACKTWITAIQAGINAAFHDTEYKSGPKLTMNELSPYHSSWSSSFSFKALQQQATSRLNSLGSNNEVIKEASKVRVAKNDFRSQENKMQSDESDEQDQMFKVDEKGRSYIPLRDDDDDEVDGNNEPKDNQNTDRSNSLESTNYPAAADCSNPEQAEPPKKPQRAYMIILAQPGNDKCADCNATQPMWASINLGITLCIECAGIHRSLGVHLSKVRSLTLDTEVWSPEIVKLMLSLGNTSVNMAYLSCYRDQMPPLEPESSREHREAWIKGKYLLKSFMRPPGEDLNDSNEQGCELVGSRRQVEPGATGSKETRGEDKSGQSAR